MDIKNKLIKLITDNPHLPIVSMVNIDVEDEEGSQCWVAELSDVRIEEYIIANEHVWLRDDDDEYYVVEDKIGRENVEKMTNDEITQAYNNLPWIKAILLEIK